jgi:hypothetical protein
VLIHLGFFFFDDDEYRIFGISFSLQKRLDGRFVLDNVIDVLVVVRVANSGGLDGFFDILNELKMKGD